MPLPVRRIVGRIFRFFIWLVGGILILLIVLVLLIQLPSIQQFAKQKALTYIQRKLGTRVQLDRLRIIFPKQIVLEGLYLEDQHRDTLLAGARIQVDISLFRLLKKDITVSSIELDGIRANVYRKGTDTAFNYAYILKAFAGAPDTSHKADTAGGFTFHLGKIHLHHIIASFTDEVGGTAAYVNLGDFDTRITDFDPSHSVYGVSKVSVGGLIARYANTRTRLTTSLRLKALRVTPDSLDLAHSRYVVSDISLDSADLAYDNDARKRVARGMDYNHLKVSSLILQADHIGVAPNAYKGNIRQVSFTEQSGLNLKKLTANVTYTDKEAHIKGLDILTDHSEIKNETDARYPSIDTLSSHLGLLYIDTRMAPTTIAVSDLVLFVPALAKQLKNPALSSIYINTRINGYVGDLTIPQFELRGASKTVLALTGNIKGLPDANKAYYRLKILRLQSSASDIAALVPRSALPANIHIPRDMSASGTFLGTVKSFQASLLANTTNGQVQVQGQLNLAQQSYQATLGLTALDLGYILGQSGTLGKVTLQAKAQGQGFQYPALQTDVQAKMPEGQIKGYTYKNLSLTVHFRQGQGTIHSDIDDPAIHYVLDATAHVAKGSRYPALQMTLQVDTLDAGALHLVTDTLQASGLLTADFASTNPDSLQGHLDLLHGWVRSGIHLLREDSMALVATHPADSQYLHLYTDVAVVDWKGKFGLTKAAPALMATLHHYITLPGAKDTVVGAQSWALDGRLIPSSPIVLTLVPALSGSDTIGFHSTYNSADNDLRFVLRAPHVRYGTDTVYKIDMTLTTASRELDYVVKLDKAMIGAIPLNQTQVSGRVADNKLYTTLLLKDTKAKDWYRIGAQISQKAGWNVSLDPDSLLLNHDPWTVSRDNAIHYDSTGIIARDVQISRQGQSITLNSTGTGSGAPLDISFANFHLSALTSAAGQDSLLADGILDGKAELTHLTSSPVFTSDLTIKDLSYKSDTLGTLSLKVNNEEANTYAADISLEGHQSDLTIKGKYFTGESKMDMTLHLGALNLAAAKPFAASQLDDIRGILRGDMHITGSLTHPIPDGNLHFDSALISPNITGEPLRLSNDNIEFDNTGFNFDKFALQDSAGNKATVDGNVFTTDFRAFKFDMTFNAANFRLVNAPQASNRLFYGKLNMDAAVNLEGDLVSPKVDGDLHINKQTDFTFVLPENDPEVVNRLGVVRFVDKAHPGDTVVEKMTLDSASAVAPMKGMNISANIATDSSANFTMIIDQRNGDAIKVRGRSTLNFGMDESGKTSLTGAYDISAGSYSLTLDVLKRTFLIQRGSTITWTGDPTSALLNLTALYLANTAPIDLVEDELAGNSPAETNKYKQKLPFTVSLMMNGELLKPVITFDINLPNNLLLLWPEVDTKLQQVRSDPSELNKQVFALLLLGRFVGENPLESGAGGTSAAQLAFQSASQILTGELNQLAGSLIKGVDINFDLNNTQNYYTGQEQDQTDLGVTVSKGLFNDRIKVNVGSDFELQGTQPGQNASNIGGDLSVDYELTKDGRYMLRAYRKNQYDYIVEGEVVETGLSFILTLDYNKFREIFGKYFEPKLQDRKIAHGS